MPDRRTNLLIRRAVEAAAIEEEAVAPFVLSGRGHEPRVTLDRSLAATLRGAKLPHVRISGYGANVHYPRRVLERARRNLESELGRSPIAFGVRGAYRDLGP